VYGDAEGELLLVGWGSTRGAIEEAVDRMREVGASISGVHHRFLSPLEPGLKDTFSRFKEVVTVELNYSDSLDDPLITAENRRYAQLAWLLRAHTLVDIDCFSMVPGHPMQPRMIIEMAERRLGIPGVTPPATNPQKPPLSERDRSCLA
jgi:2-oxoglutarate ferredoxin oxidoreductase subunit alpha